MSGLAERWQRSDQNSPLSQVTIHDGNQLTVIPIVGWTCRAGAISVDLTLYHNAFDTPTQPFPPPPAAPPLGNGWRHSYMASLSQDMMTGNVTVTEGDGRKHLFTKNPDGSYTRPAGVFETLVKNPDASFRLTRKDQVKWNFGSAGKLTSIVELNNNSISLSYDGSGRVSSLADPSGRTLNFTYDGSGFLTSVTDPLNRVFTFSYTGTPQSLWKVNEPSPSTFFLQFGYDGTKKVTSVKDKRGNVWTFNYEPTTRRLTYVTDPASKTRNYSYPTSSRTTVQDENGNSVTYVFGSSGQVTAIDRFPIPMGQPLTESFTYDSNFNVTQQTKPSGSIWEFTYDSNGNLLTVEDPITRLDPAITRATITWNASNHMTSVRDASGHQHNYSYDAFQNLTQVTDAASNIATYGYDSFGNRTSQTVNGKTTNLGYDANGYLTSITDPLGNVTRWTYNAIGWRTSRTDALNRITNYAYDTMGRLTTVTYPDNSTVTFAYDANGNRTSMTDTTGTTTWAFDALNRVTSETKGSDSISYGYDAGGRRTSLTDQAGVTVTYGYDGMNLLTSASRDPSWNASYGYDSNSNLSSQTNPNGTTVALSYNSADWLTSLVNKQSDGTTLSSFTYEYNTDGLRRGVTEADGTQLTYGFDALHRLTSEVRTGTNPYNISYGYDPAGNRLNKVVNGVGTSYTYDDANRLLTAGSTSYTWNANGDLTSKTEGGVTTAFAYNFDDQLTSIIGPTTVTFADDGLGRRVSRTTGGVTTTFVFDGSQVTTEKEGATISGHYLYGLNRLSRDDGTNFFYYLSDGLGSTRQLTDAAQAVAASYAFEAFGAVVAQSGSAVNPYRFAESWNYRDDGDGGLVQVGIRYYDPAVGRFTSTDPWLGDIALPQSLNRYQYALNNPVNMVDVSGGFPWFALVLAVLALAWAAYVTNQYAGVRGVIVVTLIIIAGSAVIVAVIGLSAGAATTAGALAGYGAALAVAGLVLTFVELVVHIIGH